FHEIIHPLFEKEKKSLQELLLSLQQLVDKKETKLYLLYGSIVNHTENPNSDLDLLIVTENKKMAEQRIIKKQSEIAEKFGNEVSVTLWSPEEFKKKKNSPFLQTAKKNAIIIYGDWNENSERQ
ncbi:MAG: nucleotidyltransferase domain-containing protein, partial [Nanoarchaeota archaeon]